MHVTPIASADIAIEEVGAVLPLSGRFDQAVAEQYVDAGQMLASLKQDINDPQVASNPQRMFELQTQLEHYTKRMTITAGLVNHGVKTVETLLKS